MDWSESKYRKLFAKHFIGIKGKKIQHLNKLNEIILNFNPKFGL
jgi:hypothetical protein